MVSFRDEMRYLPGFFENVAPLVDGIVCLDDHSSDGSAEFAAGQPSVLEVIPMPPGTGRGDPWNDSLNHRLLVERAWRHDPDWLMGVDADERLEQGFRARSHAQIARARRHGWSAYWVPVREIWDDPDTYRVDGLWGIKRSARFFEARRDHLFDQSDLHGLWGPLNDIKDGGELPTADLTIYHLRMLRPEDRLARRRKYERIDAAKRWQRVGYAYMTDMEGLELERIPAGRGYHPPGR